MIILLAFNRDVEHIGMRFTTADIMGAAAEVLCYGTAVVV